MQIISHTHVCFLAKKERGKPYAPALSSFILKEALEARYRPRGDVV